jgi:hypothetical protein
MLFRPLAFILLDAVLIAPPLSAQEKNTPPIKEVSSKRIDEIAALLGPEPRGFGAPYHDRAAWDSLADRPEFKKVIADAEKRLPQSFPAWNEEDFLDYSRTGSRVKSAKLFDRRDGWLAPLVWAECLENKNRFTQRLNEILTEYARQKTWTRPFNNPATGNPATQFGVGLEGALFARELAQALYLLDDKVEPSVQAEVMKALRERIFDPVLYSYQTGKGHWWIKGRNNWNSVCLSGVTAAALASLPSREERAVFAAAAEHFSANNIAGFKDDGFCGEGPGYYNYGFGEYLVLRETLLQATGGKLDLLADPKTRRIALYGPRIGILNDIVPAYSDCRQGTKIDRWLLWYCDRVLGLGLAGMEGLDFSGPAHNLATGCLRSFPNSATKTAPATAASSDATGLRSYFDKAGALVCRPGPGGRLGVFMKGGVAHENHNHNDLGSYVVVVGHEQLAGDPGGPLAYNSKTFGPERYTAFKTFASYGHPVPLVAGVQQKEGTASVAKVLRTEFTDSRDLFSLDLAAAYPLPGLKSLVRDFEYNRANGGSFTVRDEFNLDAPGEFETALITNGDWSQPEPDTLEFTLNGESVRITIRASADWKLAVGDVTEDAPIFHRLAVALKQPATAGWVSVTYTPASK